MFILKWKIWTWNYKASNIYEYQRERQGKFEDCVLVKSRYLRCFSCNLQLFGPFIVRVLEVNFLDSRRINASNFRFLERRVALLFISLSSSNFFMTDESKYLKLHRYVDCIFALLSVLFPQSVNWFKLRSQRFGAGYTFFNLAEFNKQRSLKSIAIEWFFHCYSLVNLYAYTHHIVVLLFSNKIMELNGISFDVSF